MTEMMGRLVAASFDENGHEVMIRCHRTLTGTAFRVYVSGRLVTDTTYDVHQAYEWAAEHGYRYGGPNTRDEDLR